VVTLTGANFDPTGSLVTCQFTTGAPASTSTLTLHPTGGAAGTIRVTSADAVGTNPIVCTQTSHSHTLLTTSTPFVVTALVPTCAFTTTPTCAVGQVVGATVTGTDLAFQAVRNSTPNASGGVNPTTLVVALSGVRLGSQSTSPACATPDASHICSSGGSVASNGHLNSIVVNDNRGDLAGWTVTGQMASDFAGPTVGHDHSIPADYLTWFPAVSPASTSCVTLGTAGTCGPSDVIGEITAGPSQALSKATSAVLCQAAPGGGGGGTKCTAKLILTVPPYIVAGHYTATIEIVIS
jgi:hypothetical protein